jgi:hypothetical protein
MDKVFIDRGGTAEGYSGTERRKHVRFPVCLAIKYGEDVSEDCLDFILNTSKGGVFVRSDCPLPKGTKVIIHFYIPPEDKLLGKFKGKVVGVNLDDRIYPKGMYIKFIDYTKEDMRTLEDYLEEKRHLVDKTA